MGFGTYLTHFLKSSPLFEEKVTSEVKTEEVKNLIDSKVGGEINDSTAIATSFEALSQAFDKLPLSYVSTEKNIDLENIFKSLTDKSRLDFFEKYAKKEENVAISTINRINSIDIDRDPINYRKLYATYVLVSERLLKIYHLVNNQIQAEPVVNEAITLDDEAKKKVNNILNSSKKGIDGLTQILEIEKKRIESVPENSVGDSDLDRIRTILDELGLLSLLRDSVNAKQKKIETDEQKKGAVATNKKKKRICNRLIDSISLAQLPALSNGEIDAEGEYYRFFKALEKQNPAWMDLSLEKYVFRSKSEALSSFNASARIKESAKEEDQLTYLAAAYSWCLSYIKSDKDGSLNDKEETNFVTKIDNAKTEKEKEIKNYYLSRDFNLGNFGGIKLKPEIRLPLYAKVKLPVTEADRIKESPLRNFISGLGTIIKGLASMIPDTGNEAFAQKARAQNIAVFNGLNSIVKAGVTLVGGKQAGRDYAEKIPNFGDKGKSKVKEDMLAPVGMAGAPLMNPETPGQFMQTPDSATVPNNMDILSLAGPGKKTKKKKKKQEETKSSTRVSSFAEFMQSK